MPHEQVKMSPIHAAVPSGWSGGDVLPHVRTVSRQRLPTDPTSDCVACNCPAFRSDSSPGTRESLASSQEPDGRPGTVLKRDVHAPQR